MTKKITQEEAFELLKKECEPWEREGITYYYEIGEFLGKHTSTYDDESLTSFIWLVYPYNSKEPLDRKSAYIFHVISETKQIIQSDCLFYDEEIERLINGTYNRGDNS